MTHLQGNIRFVRLHCRRKCTYPIHIWFISTFQWGLKPISEYRNPCDLFPAYMVVGHIWSVPHGRKKNRNWVTWTMQCKLFSKGTFNWSKFKVKSFIMFSIFNSAVKQLIASKIKVFVYIKYVCVLCIFIMYISFGFFFDTGAKSILLKRCQCLNGAWTDTCYIYIYIYTVRSINIGTSTQF